MFVHGFCILFFSIANKLYCMSLVQMLNSFFLLWLFQVLYLYIFSSSPCFFQKLHCLCTWKILSQNIFLAMHGFNKVFYWIWWPHTILICGLMLLLILLCVWHILFYHSGWMKFFELFQFSFIQAKRVNYCEGWCIFFRILNINFKKISFITILIVVFYKI